MAQFVVVPDGRGYLVSSNLPTLARGQTYQLWGIVGNQPISLGLLGSTPNQAVFTMAGTNRPVAAWRSPRSPRAASVMPTSAVVATGTV